MSGSVSEKANQKSNPALLRFLSRSAQIEEAAPPIVARMTMLIVSGAVFASLFLFSVTQINEIARAQGVVEPVGLERDIQHPTGGVVTEIHAQDGQHVKIDQPIITLRNTDLEKDLARARHRSNSLRVQLSALRAYLDETDQTLQSLSEEDRTNAITTNAARKAALGDKLMVVEEQVIQKNYELDVLHKQLDLLHQQAAVAKDIFEKRTKLNEQGYVTGLDLINSEQSYLALQSEIEIVEARIESAKSSQIEYKAKAASMISDDRSAGIQNLNAISAQLTENEEFVAKLFTQSQALVVRATTDGVLNGMNIASVGGLVRPATTITKIVPTGEKLVANVRIDPRDIGRLMQGSTAQIRFKAYDFERYGGVTGVVESISAASFLGEDGRLYYTARIVPDRTTVGPDNNLFPIRPGMTVSAEIVTGKRNVMQYLLKPIHVAMSSAMTEN